MFRIPRGLKVMLSHELPGTRLLFKGLITALFTLTVGGFTEAEEYKNPPFLAPESAFGIDTTPGFDPNNLPDGPDVDVDPAAFARVLSMEVDSAEFKDILKNKIEPLPDSLLQSDRPVLKHFKGSGKTPYPPKETLIPKIKMTRKEMLKLAEKHVRSQVDQYLEWLVLEPIPDCKQNYTDRVERPVKITGQEDKLLFDMLFLSNKAAKRLKKQRPDANTNMVLYDPERPNGGAYTAKTYGLECLPIRIRATGAFLFYHYGDDALKRYAKNPNGEGEWFLDKEQ